MLAVILKAQRSAVYAALFSPASICGEQQLCKRTPARKVSSDGLGGFMNARATG